MSSTGTVTGVATLTIRVNDAPHPLPAPATIADLVRSLGLADRKGVALAVNDTVVPRGAWPAHALAEGDRVLVIRATQGG